MTLIYKPNETGENLVAADGDTINVREHFYMCTSPVHLVYPAVRIKEPRAFQGIDVVKNGQRINAGQEEVILPAGSLLLRDRNYWTAFMHPWEYEERYTWVGIPPNQENPDWVNLQRCIPRPNGDPDRKYSLASDDHTVSSSHNLAFTRACLGRWPDQEKAAAHLEDVKLLEDLGLRNA